MTDFELEQALKSFLETPGTMQQQQKAAIAQRRITHLWELREVERYIAAYCMMTSKNEARLKKEPEFSGVAMSKRTGSSGERGLIDSMNTFMSRGLDATKARVAELERVGHLASMITDAGKPKPKAPKQPKPIQPATTTQADLLFG